MHDGVARLIGAEVLGLVYSDAGESNVFVDHSPSSPDNAVTVYSLAGLEADSKLPYDPVDFQVVVRGDPVWALKTWRAIRSVLHGRRNFILPDGTYAVYILSTQGSPFPLGPDEEARARFSGDYRAETMSTTQERP